MDEQSDVILASAQDGQRLQSILPDGSKLIKLAFCVPPESAYALARASDGALGVVCAEPGLAALVSNQLPEDVRRLRVLRADDADARAAFFEGLDAVVVAPDWETYCDPELSRQIEGYRAANALVTFDYRIDEGSMLYLEERINRIRDERQLLPGALHF